MSAVDPAIRPRALLAVPALLGALVGGCASDAPPAPDATLYAPLIGGDADIVAAAAPDELRRLRLVATNLVAALVQIPEMRPAVATLQISEPTSAFGNVVVRALEEAGFGLQRVSADQGRNYVSYSQRFAETESGPVTDYTLSVGRIELAREYVTREGNVYPSSLMAISGTGFVADIALADDVFSEQGGSGTAFISGARASEGITDGTEVRTVDVNEFDELPVERRTSQESVLVRARRLYFERDATRSRPELARFDRYRRTVLIFEDARTQFMGSANKRAVRLLVREFRPRDLLVIKACHDADGRDEAARDHAIRVEEELVSHGVPAESAWIAPCVRASYRRTTGDAPAPVEVIHYRPKG